MQAACAHWIDNNGGDSSKVKWVEVPFPQMESAVVFGLSHTGDDFVGLEAVIPTMLAMIVVGYVGGLIARRTHSLTLPLAIHAAADIPLYFYWACRAA